MHEPIIQLYPLPSREMPLDGLYLAHDLRQYGQASGRVFVYGNFVVSLDGRIAIPHSTRPGMTVPAQTANNRDWRLFQELAIQADVVITSGRYLRDYVDGRAQEIIRIYDDPRYADLKEWRIMRGLKAYPDLAVISRSLSFPIPEVLNMGKRSILIFTTGQADPERIEAMEAQTAAVLVAGEKSVDGTRLTGLLGQRGYRTVYSAAGPRVMHLLLASDRLDRLYLSHANRLLGGQSFSTIVEGGQFEPAIDMRLNTAYFDPYGLDGLGQLFLSYNRASSR